MKLTPFLMAAALGVGGTVLAQGRDAPRAADERPEVRREAARPATAEREAGGGVVEGTKQGARRAADATRRLANRGAERLRETGQAIERRLPGTHQEAARADDRADTRRAGAGPAAPADTDGARRSRMDDAYANWKRQQGHR